MPLSDLERGILGAISGAAGHGLQVHREKRQQRDLLARMQEQSGLVEGRQARLSDLMADQRMSLAEFQAAQAMDRLREQQESINERELARTGSNWMNQGLNRRNRLDVARIYAGRQNQGTDPYSRELIDTKREGDILDDYLGEDIIDLFEPKLLSLMRGDFARRAREVGVQAALAEVRAGIVGEASPSVPLLPDKWFGRTRDYVPIAQRKKKPDGTSESSGNPFADMGR